MTRRQKRGKKGRAFRRIRFFILLILTVVVGNMGWQAFKNQNDVSADPFPGSTGQEELPLQEPAGQEPEPQEPVIPESPVSAYPEAWQAASRLPYFIEANLERYIQYQQTNSQETQERIITFVNLNLDQPYYTDIQQIKQPDDITVLSNKYRALPADYIPPDLENISGTDYLLRHEARVAFEAMQQAAKAQGLTLFPVSAYRSYAYQEGLYNRYLNGRNQEEVDRFSARPGHSEHQLGLAVDVLATQVSVAETAEHAWYAAHGHEYGFIIRYPKEEENITGYSYEPWHLRYLGVELATAVYESGLTYDEYYIRFIEPQATLVSN